MRWAVKAAAAGVAALLSAQTAAQQNPDDIWWEDSMGVHYCPGGQAWDTTTEACAPCREGKQSRHNSTMPCSFCPQTLMPNSNQSGCVCQPLHFNVWVSSAGAENELLQCTPCTDVLVALAYGNEPADADGSVNAGKLPCQACNDTSADSCTGGVQCECPGGPKGDARLCPVDGYWLEYRGGEPDSAINASFDPDVDMPTSRQERAETFEMLECTPPVGGRASRCLHWSRCLEEADAGPEDDDPLDVQRAADAEIKSVYVSDQEYEVWKAVAGPDRAKCGGDRWSPHRVGFSTEQTSLAGDPNCCMPGYTGRICEQCVPPMMKIDGRCIKCKEINYWRLLSGTFFTLLFVLWMMRKSVKPFKDCNGKAAIIIFFFQTVQLLFKDRVPDFIDVASNYVDLNFYRHTTSSCTIPMTYYEQFFVDLFASPCAMGIIYMVVMAVTYATSHTSELSSYATQAVTSAARVTILVNTLGKMDTFKMLSKEDRHILARMLSMRRFRAGEDILVEGDVPEKQPRDQGEFYIIYKGEVAVKIKNHGTEDGISHHVRTLGAGSHVGEVALVADSPRTATVTALGDVQCASLSRQGFAELQDEFGHNKEFLKLFNIAKARVKSIDDATRRILARSQHLQSTEDDSSDKVKYLYGPHASERRDTTRTDVRTLDSVERRIVLLHRKTHHKHQQQRVHEIEVRVKENCCCFALKLNETIKNELLGIYHACINPTARRAAVLEISIYLYGPLTLQTMQVLFCKNVNDVSYPVREPTIDCHSTTHQRVQMFAWGFLITVAAGVIGGMYAAASKFYGALETDPNKDGLTLARELSGDMWDQMSFAAQQREVERCGHRLRVQVLGSECFMLSALQMSVRRDCAHWYPQWHLVRRTLLNLAYMGGLARGGKMPPVFWGMDWRVFVMVVLSISSTMQYHFRPFRDNEEDRLEMWGLQFIMIMVVVDFGHDFTADKTQYLPVSFAVAVMLCLAFLAVAVHSWRSEHARAKHSAAEWTQIRAWYDHDELTGAIYKTKASETEDAPVAELEQKASKLEAKGLRLSPWSSGYKRQQRELSGHQQYSNPFLDDNDDS